MVKAKRRQLAALAANKDYTLHGLVESSNSRTEGDLEDDDWVIVKKQRITILVPPLPSVQPTTALGPPRTKKRQPKSRRKIKRRQPPIPSERHQRKRSHDEELQNFDAVLTSKGDTRKSDALMTSKGDTRINGKNPASSPNIMKKLTEPVSRRRTTLKGPSRLIGDDSMYHPTTPITQVHDHERVWQGASGSSQAVMASGVPKAVNKKKRLTTTTFLPPAICPNQGPTRLFVRTISCLNMGLGVLQQNQKMRASNLERKLEKAGGLSRWLMSLGLGQYVQMFRGRNVNDKFQLLNLTMGKLKDMGVIAVGPRRKLMHAIDCLSFQGCTLRRGLLEKRVFQE
ncbi:Sterile alpha motif domain [Macleaya cordata]|uniref:Sterile alpha motif domain n=1 Tax=Macleaya cordata TaxID=56857 RepID=A0A200PRN9_MACCD|nr:Sterile alpha motif domain [Macleaya cordata]